MTKPAPPISVGVIIPAAGSSKRLGGRRKQLRLLDGKPLLVQTALAFEQHPEILMIAVVAPDDAVDEVAQSCEDYGLSKVSSVVAGGRTRQDSVRIGLEALPPEIEIVLTHDAARPFIAANEISRLIEQTVESGAASTAASVSDTLCRTVGGVAGDTVSRDGLFRMLTPQGFRRAVLLSAHEQAKQVYTDEVTLVRAAGYDVALIETSLINIKITTQADWDLARWMWPAWRNA